MADLNDDNHLFEEMSPGTIGRNIVRRLGLASQVAEAIRSNNNTRSKSTSEEVKLGSHGESLIGKLTCMHITCTVFGKILQKRVCFSLGYFRVSE